MAEIRRKQDSTELANQVQDSLAFKQQEAAVAAPVVRPVAAANAQPAVADDEPEEEEGC